MSHGSDFFSHCRIYSWSNQSKFSLCKCTAITKCMYWTRLTKSFWIFSMILSGFHNRLPPARPQITTQGESKRLRSRILFQLPRLVGCGQYDNRIATSAVIFIISSRKLTPLHFRRAIFNSFPFEFALQTHRNHLFEIQSVTHYLHLKPHHDGFLESI